MPLIASRAGGSVSGFGGLRSFAPAVAPDTGAMFPIAMANVGSAGASTITFSSIPDTYKHLQIRWIAKSDRTETDDVVKITFNSDATANYSWHWLRGNGATTAAGASASDSSIEINYGATGNSNATNIFAGSVVDILDYTSINKYKTIRSLNGFDLNTVNVNIIYLHSGNWRSFSPITSITLDQRYGSNFLQYSQFALYGIKG